MDGLKPDMVKADRNKILINIGCLFDIPTGKYLRGAKGESILLGGLGMATGVVGIGNNFKSTIMHYMMLSAYSRISASTRSVCMTYDTEINMDQDRLLAISRGVDLLRDKDIIEDEEWLITDKTKYSGTAWYMQVYRPWIKNKIKNAKKFEVETPFLNKDGSVRTMIVPTFGELDSLTKYGTDETDEMQDKNAIGSSGMNMFYMKSGQAKAQFLNDQPNLLGSSGHYLLMSAHVGKETMIASAGPMPAQPTKKLTEMKNGDRIKGATDDFTFLTSNIWHCYNATPYLNQGTKGPEYPKTSKQVNEGDKDLYLVHVRLVRSKHGKTGPTVSVLVSQTEGVLPTLTEFHYLKDYGKKFGMSGNDRNYSMDLYPEVNLMRTTVREKIDTDALLRQAIHITSQMAQMYEHWFYLPPEYICSPKELYEDLKAKGYDWRELLSTRDWWTVNDYEYATPRLSTMDLLRMRLPETHPDYYVPYWIKGDK